MRLDPAACHRALRARDARFDGLFFVGVRTTGIYCRPICPARTPRAERCEFFAHAAEAERAGFRACFRCRPELAPGVAAVDSVPRLVRRAAARIEAGWLNERSIDALAASLGVTARHLRRAMEAEMGVAPVQLAQTRRLALAKQLLHDTRLSLADVAFASGFASVRRFNALFRARFGRPPSAVRREHARDDAGGDAIVLRLAARPPFDFAALLAFLAPRAIAGVESVADGEYRRAVALDGRRGWVRVEAANGGASLRARVAPSLAPKLTEVAARLRALFDLDARPDVIAAALRRDRALRPLVAARPGLRVTGAFDPFETAIRAVLGQQVSVRAATTVAGRLAARFGTPLAGGPAGVDRVFPAASVLAAAPLGEVRAIGVPASRARTVIALARAVASGAVDLSGAPDPERTIGALLDVPGVGPWTAQVIAMRAVGWPDAFPAGDLGVRAALGVSSAAAAAERAEAWRPWRAYAVMQLWCSALKGG